MRSDFNGGGGEEGEVSLEGIDSYLAYLNLLGTKEFDVVFLV
jgi:hypothetical protein